MPGFLTQDLYEQCHDGSCPNLIHDSILIGADETFDFQVLLDLLAEKLNLPAFLIKCSDLLRRQIHIVREEFKPAICLFVIPLNHAKFEISTSLTSGRTVKLDRVVAVIVRFTAAPFL